jgi:CubicO group peptidase (beta-lactamase class C family)
MLSLILFLIGAGLAMPLSAQSLYFPPAGPNWETLDPVADLNWCPEKLDTLRQFLGDVNTKGFMILKDGRIAVEWYFGSFTRDSIWYWASAGKSLTATLVGIAAQEGLVDLDAPSATYLGPDWSACGLATEAQITVRHHLSMSTGLDDGAPNSDCTDPGCLQCLAPPGSRWAYHNAPYTLLESVVANASGQTLNGFFATRLGNKIGALGLYLPIGFNRVFFSRTRDMARFGLLIQAGGTWNGVPVLSDTAYYQAMINTSQPHNLSYGYLWWLNGKGQYMVPGLQLKINQDLIPAAPKDLFAGLGKDDQKVYIVPSQGLVVVRLGESAGGFNPALSGFDSQLWEKIGDLPCTVSTEDPESPVRAAWRARPNPATSIWYLDGGEGLPRWSLHDMRGSFLREGRGREVMAGGLPEGTYFLLLRDENGHASRLVLQRLGGD